MMSTNPATRDQIDPALRKRPRQYGYWRAGTLALVYLLIGLHIAQWKITGKTLAPLEFNEVMYTLEMGILTAGFLFMALAALSVVFVGRFFCSWGCHILALEDLSAWALDKIGIHPKPVRVRSLLLVPPGAMVYMFVWPQISRLIEGRAMPVMHITTDESGWASFLTTNFWRNLPGPGVVIVTFFVVGFVIVYLLGSRSFCKYVCPYGAVFSLADRVAPGKIVSLGDCSGCGICTAKCSSDIRVHEELTVFGKVVSPSCLKDLDCISSCPEGAIGFGFTTPAFFKSFNKSKQIKQPRYDFTLGQEATMVLVFFVVLFAYRGLYGLVPFFLSMAMGVIVAFLFGKCLQLVQRPHVRLNTFQLKLKGKVSHSGRVLVGLGVLFVALTAHSAVIRYHEFVGWNAVKLLEHPEQIGADFDANATVESASAHLAFTKRWGFYIAPVLDEKLSELQVAKAQLLVEGGDLEGAIGLLSIAGRDFPDSALIHHNLAGMLAMGGHDAQAIDEYNAALALDQTNAETWNNLGYLLSAKGELKEAEYCFRASIERDPDFAHPYFNLARALVMQGQRGEVESLVLKAAALDPQSYARFVQPSTPRTGQAP